MDNVTNEPDERIQHCFVRTKCFTFLSGRQNINKEHLLAAGVFSLTLVPLVILANTLLLSYLRRRQKFPGNFRRLLQLLCIADLFVGAVSLPTYAAALLFYPSRCHCNLELAAQYSAAMFGGTSGRTTVMIAFEQSVHIKSIAIHPFMQTKRYKILICSVSVVVSLIVAASVTIATKYGIYRQVSGAFTILDIVFLGAVIFLYLSAYHSVHRHIISSKLRSSRKFKYNQVFAKKVTRIIFVLLICYGPFIVTNFWQSFVTEDYLGPSLKLVNIWSYNIVYANSFLNALVFLCKDGLFGNDARPRVAARQIGQSKSSASKNTRSRNDIPLQGLDIRTLNFGVFEKSHS